MSKEQKASVTLEASIFKKNKDHFAGLKFKELSNKYQYIFVRPSVAEIQGICFVCMKHEAKSPCSFAPLTLRTKINKLIPFRIKRASKQIPEARCTMFRCRDTRVLLRMLEA